MGRLSDAGRLHPKYSYDKSAEHALGQWERLAEQNRFLVHAFDLDKFERGDLSKRRAEDVFKSWDVFSTSLVDSLRVFRYRRRYKNTGSAIPTQVFGELGFILEVPPQNILGTFPEDVMFPTHLPSKDFKFADAILNGVSKLFSQRLVEKYNKVVPPSDIIGRTAFHNEVLVVGKPNVNIYCTMTQPIRVRGILYAPKFEVAENNRDRSSFERLDFISRLRQLNPGLGVVQV